MMTLQEKLQVDTSESANDYTLACMRALYNFYNSHGNVVRNMLVADINKVKLQSLDADLGQQLL